MKIKFRFMLFLLLCISEDSASLKCHKCVSLDCPQINQDDTDNDSSELICKSAKRFLELKLNNIYYKYGLQIPFCPSLQDWDGWRNIESNPGFTTSCPGNDNRAQCSVGRFKITTITETVHKNENFTTYGTSLGCLANVVKGLNQCSFLREWSSRDPSGTRHFLEIEHCRTIKEMCQDSDFCIRPEGTRVKKFRDDVVDNNWKTKWKWTLVCVFILIIVIVVLFLLGIKYEGSDF